MSRIAPLVLAAALCATRAVDLVGSVPAPAPVPADSTYQRVFAELSTLAPTGEQAAVENLILERDAGRFTLTTGTIHLLTPVADRTIGAVFEGEGVFTFTPPTAVEREQLERFYKAAPLDQPFRSLVLLFTDTTLAELRARLAFAPGQGSREARDRVRDALEYLRDEKAQWFHTGVMGAALNGTEDGLFYAHVAERRRDPLFFEIDPSAVEEVKLLRRARNTRGREVAEVICQFHRREDYAGDRDLAAERKDVVAITHYAVESTIARNLEFHASARLTIRGLVPTLRWVRLGLYSELQVDSARWADGRPATTFRGRESSSLWVAFEPALAADETRELTVHYHGDLIERGEGMNLETGPIRMGPAPEWISLRSSTGWYPRYGGGYGSTTPATFDVTFHTPTRYPLVSVGTQVHREVRDGVLTQRWVTQRPAVHASFNLGRFDTLELRDPRIPPVTILIQRAAHDELQRQAADQRLFLIEQRNMEEVVGADIANSLSFFRQRFGEPLVDRFYATEIPDFHGQAFPGLLHLSWVTFQWTDEKGRDEMFRAHEMAHQWWGLGVAPRTYRDAWISEGFAEFAGLWYMQLILEDNDKYFRMLREWRDALHKRRGKSGPIGLGTRTYTSTTEDDYSLVVYRKGAWVLHMLRNLMLDLRTMNEDAFGGLLTDFYTRHRDGAASTEDFRAAVEQHVGMEMDWFFDQWVYGTAIPTYEFSYRTTRTEDGQYIVRVRVDQNDVPEDFRMYVPLVLDFGPRGTAPLRLLVKGARTEVELPPVPYEPEQIVFNALESVLARVKTVRWRN